MDHQPTQGAIQVCLDELSAVTVAIGEQIHDKPASTVSLSDILEYIDTVKNIHGRLANVFTQKNGYAETIDQFFDRWNNLLLGIFYVEGLIKQNNSLTEKQHEIFILCLEEIHDFATKFGIARR